MTENLRKRVSKWDVETTPDGDVPSKIRQENLLSQQSDVFLKDQETNLDFNASKCDTNQISTHTDIEGNITVQISEIAEVEQLTEYADDGSIRTFNDSSKLSEYNRHSDMEIDPEDDCKKPCQELISESQIKVTDSGDRETEGCDTAPGQTHRRNMSPYVHSQRRRSRSFSPKNGRNRSYRNRSNSRGRSKSRSWSRSRSRSSSRSPSYRSRRGSEKGIGKERMVSRGAEPCRDFSSGRCRRGSQCRFLHDDARRQYEKHSSRVTLEKEDNNLHADGRRQYEKHASRGTLEKGDSNLRDDARRQYEKHSSRGPLEKGDSNLHDDARKLYNKHSSRSTLEKTDGNLHDDARRQYDKYSPRGTSEKGDSKFGRVRSSGFDSKDNVTILQAERDYSHYKQSDRNGNQYDDDRKKSELHKNNRSSEHYQRGSICRFIHHDSASQGGLNADGEAKEKMHGRRDADASFHRRIEPHKADDDDAPSQFLAEGHGQRGDVSRFSHQDMTHVVSKERLRGGNRLGEDVIVLSVPNSGDRPAVTYLNNSSQRISNVASATKGASVEFVGREVLRQDPHLPKYTNPVERKYENLSQEAPQRSVPSQIHNGTPIASEQHQQVVAVSTKSMSDSTSVQQSSGMTVGGSGATLFHGDALGQNGSHHAVVHPLHGQNFAPNVQIQQAVPLFSSSGQMQQQASFPLPLNQLVGLQVPSAPQNFNIGLQSQVVPPRLIGQRFQSPMLGVHGQQNLQVLQNGQIQQNYNLIGQNQQGLPSPYAGHRQLNVNLNGQIQQNIPLPSHIPHGQVPGNQIVPSQTSLAPIYSGQGQQHHDFSSQRQQNLHLSQNLQIQQALSSLGSHGQNQQAALQHPSDTRSLKPNEHGHQINLQQSANLHQPTQTAGDGLTQKIDIPAKPSELSSDTTTQQVVTSEQAAQISNLSASLAQFFESAQNLPQLYATLNPLTVVGSAPSQPFLNPGSVRPVVPAAIPTASILPGQGDLVQQHQDPASDRTEPIIPETSDLPPGFSANPVEQKDLELENSHASKGVTTLAFTGEEEEAEVIADNELKEVNGAETDQTKKEQATRSEDADLEIRNDGESKRGKDAKGLRVFKCALVEFVKDILKPHWKEGLLSKEVHKTIVKKVVDKVTVVMQNGTVPQTPEKIEHYLSHSKAKLNKLVQAYMEKYA